MAVEYVTLLFAWLCVVQVLSLQYRDLEALGVQLCPTKNVCQQIGSADFSARICECDESCRFYGDCCIDVASSRSRPSPETCMQFGSEVFQGAYVIGSCPESYTGPSTLATLCLNGNASDPFRSAPVTDTANQKTYLNQFCALCNDASPDSLQSWIVSMICPTQETEETRQADLRFSDDLKQWGILIQDKFLACRLSYDKPSYIQNGIRLCRANLISACPSSFRRKQYVRACSQYTSVVMDKKWKLYSNPHCAICNGVITDEIQCFNPKLYGKKETKFSLAKMFDFNIGQGNIVGEVQSCSSGNRWDPFFNKCRKVGCIYRNYKKVNGKCQKQ